jgi:hypothetical protein
MVITPCLDMLGKKRWEALGTWPGWLFAQTFGNLNNQCITQQYFCYGLYVGELDFKGQ